MKSPTKAMDEQRRERDLFVIRQGGYLAAQNGFTLLCPSAYANDNAKRDAWIDGYLSGIRAKGKTNA